MLVGRVKRSLSLWLVGDTSTTFWISLNRRLKVSRNVIKLYGVRIVVASILLILFLIPMLRAMWFTLPVFVRKLAEEYGDWYTALKETPYLVFDVEGEAK